MTTMVYTTNPAEQMADTNEGEIVYSPTTTGPRSGGTRINRDTPIVESGWKLAFDLYVELEYSDSGVVAFCSWVDDCGHGKSETEATADLLLSLANLRESLESRSLKANFSEELGSTLSKLRDLLVTSG